jgi:hypothetical protein
MLQERARNEEIIAFFGNSITRGETMGDIGRLVVTS